MRWGGCANTPRDVENLKALKFDFAEILLSFSASRRRWWESGIRSDPNGFQLIGHGPLTDSADDVRSLWDHYVPTLKSTVDTAHRLGIKLLTIHMDVSRSVVTFERYEKLSGIRELLRKEKIRALSELVLYAQTAGVTIALENVSESAAELAEAIEMAPGLRITLDVGHGQLGVERNRAFDIIEKLGQSIVHVHLHDNDGVDDLHLPPGDGTIDLKGILGALLRQGYYGTVTFEVEDQYLVRSRDYVQGLLGGREVDHFGQEGSIITTRADEVRAEAVAPRVGIFYIVDGRVFLDSVEASTIRSPGKFISFNRSHVLYWETIVASERPDLKGRHFAFYPRGRVNYFKDKEKFVIWYDPCLPDHVIEEIRRRMGLNADNSELVPGGTSGGHYKCHGCDPVAYRNVMGQG